MNAVAQERWQGQIIDGKFALLDQLAGSAYSAVFRTELQGNAPQSAVVKLIRADSINATEQISRWKESATLSHSNLLRIFDSGYCQIDGVHWLYVVMEYAEENLDQVLPVRALAATEIAELLPPVLEALAYLHAKRLVHGRIKPSNIFAVKNQLKLSIDSVQPANQAAREHQLSAYDSPEIESGSLTGAADLWSLGMTLVAGFNQRPLSWSRSSQLAPAVPKEVPPPYNLIASECLRIDAAARCSLARIKELARQAVPVVRPVPPAKPKRKAIAPFAAGVAVLMVVLGIVLKHSTEKQREHVISPQSKTAEISKPPQAERVSKPSPTRNGTHSKRAPERARSAAAISAPITESSGYPKIKSPAPNTTSTPAAQDVVEQVLPRVPQSARNTIHGKVKVKVQVSVAPNGEVSSATLASPGPSQYFARLALEASRKWKFSPEEAVSAWLIEYKFGRVSTDVIPRHIE